MFYFSKTQITEVVAEPIPVDSKCKSLSSAHEIESRHKTLSFATSSVWSVRLALIKKKVQRGCIHVLGF